MRENIITIDTVNEITQAEYCRRTGETLAGLAPKLKKFSVRDIPELGIKLINIASPQFDTIRVEAPSVRDYSVTELSTLFGNLLAKYQTDAESKDAKIQSLERIIEEMTTQLENLGEELEQQKQLNEVLQNEVEAKETLLTEKETYLEDLLRSHQEEVTRIQAEQGQIIDQTRQWAEAALTDLKVAQTRLAQREEAYQELKRENEKIAQAREALLNENNTIKAENEKRMGELGHSYERVLSDLKVANFALDEKEKGYQELKADFKKISQERETLQNRLLDISKQVAETRITEELQSFKDEFLSLFRSIQQPAILPAADAPADLKADNASQGSEKTKMKKAKPSRDNRKDRGGAGSPIE